VSAGATVKDEGKNGDQRGERQDDVVTRGLSVGHSFILPFDVIWLRKTYRRLVGRKG
jgi:hypothetical protein